MHDSNDWEVGEDREDNAEPALRSLPCLEYEWGCAKYGDDRSQWCSNCQARTAKEVKEGV